MMLMTLWKFYFWHLIGGLLQLQLQVVSIVLIKLNVTQQKSDQELSAKYLDLRQNVGYVVVNQ